MCAIMLSPLYASLTVMHEYRNAIPLNLAFLEAKLRQITQQNLFLKVSATSYERLESLYRVFAA
jgi:hypothetical protein